MSKPLLSVVMITYCHENYIKEAINGVLMQKCNFDLELILLNDCSPDKTDEVIQGILITHPNSSWIKYIAHEKNIGMMPNFIFGLEQCEGKYIAICEGDDYWTNPLKLQKQFDFLENHPNYSMVCHNAQIIYESLVEKPTVFSKRRKTQDVSMKTVINEWTIPTASMVFKREYVTKLPIWFCSIYSGDYTLALLLKYHGKICFLKESMSVYRKNYTGTSASATFGKDSEFISKQHILLLNFFNEESKYIYQDLIELKIKSIKMNLEFNKLKKKSLVRAFVSFPKISTSKIYQKIKTIFIN
jgi:glycosyltransferase involved in cell wall biosynthesis